MEVGVFVVLGWRGSNNSYFMCISVLCDEVRLSITEVKNSCKLPFVCWELTPEPLEKLLVLLTAEPSLDLPPFLTLNFAYK